MHIDLPSTTHFTWFFKYLFPIMLSTFHGWLATEMAIYALFHPYKAWYFPFTSIQIPCTPGIFPKRRDKLATAVASTVTDTLLTTEDIKRQTDLLLTEKNIYLAVSTFVDSILTEFRDTTKLHRLAGDIAEISPVAIEHFVISIVDSLESGHDQRVSVITEKIFDQVVMSVRISPKQSNDISERFMEAFCTPSRIRTFLIKLLVTQNITALDDSIQAHASGPYKLLAKIIGVKRVCIEWRNYIEKEPEEAENIIADLMNRFDIKGQIAAEIANFDLRTLPLQSVSALRSNVVSFVQSFLIEHRLDMLYAVKRIESEAMATVKSAIIKFNPENIPPHWLVRIKTDVSAFFFAYLKRELGVLLEKAIPALGIYTLIANKIELFSPEQLEQLIKRVCKQELRWLVWAGTIIGAWLGFVLSLFNHFFL